MVDLDLLRKFVDHHTSASGKDESNSQSSVQVTRLERLVPLSQHSVRPVSSTASFLNNQKSETALFKMLYSEVKYKVATSVAY